MPLTHPFNTTKSKSTDNLTGSSLSSNNRSTLRPSPSSSTIASASSNIRKEVPPYRLRDNLHWRCSSCNSLVTTSETGAHLINCLIDIVGPFIGSGLLSNPSTSEHSNCLLSQSSLMQSTVQHRSNDRPRTKKLERPTPNIRHPVINETTFENEDDNAVNETSGDISCRCRKLIGSNQPRCIPENRTSPLNPSKCNLNHRLVSSKVLSMNRGVGWSVGGGKVYPPPPPPPSTASTVKSDTDKKVCNSCERSSAPERLHSHHNVRNNHHYHNHNSNNHHHHYHNQNNQHHSNHNSHTHNSHINTPLKQDQSSAKEPANISTKKPPKRSQSKDSEDNSSKSSDNFKNGPKRVEEEEENGIAENSLLHINGTKGSNDLDNYAPLLMKCYLCRQEFGTDEIETHEIECLEKWKHDNSNLPANQRVPMAFNSQGSEHRGSITSITGCDPAGWEHFKSQLTPCPKCARTFFPHRLAAHKKACLGPQAGRRSKNMAKGAK